jgi:hypothetical protein
MATPNQQLALSGTIQESGSIISMNPRGTSTSTPAPAQAQNGQGRWRPGHGKVLKIVHPRSIIIR